MLKQSNIQLAGPFLIQGPSTRLFQCPSTGHFQCPSTRHFQGPSSGHFQGPSTRHFQCPSARQFQGPSKRHFQCLSTGHKICVLFSNHAFLDIAKAGKLVAKFETHLITKKATLCNAAKLTVQPTFKKNMPNQLQHICLRCCWKEHRIPPAAIVNQLPTVSLLNPPAPMVLDRGFKS